MPGGRYGVPNSSAGLITEVEWGTTDDPANNRSWLWAELWARRTSATTFGNGSWTICIGGSCAGTSGYRSVGASWVLIASYGRWLDHNANGGLSTPIAVSGGIPGSSWSSTGGGDVWVGLTDYTVLPFAPTNLSIRSGSVATTCFGVDYSRNSYDAVDQDQAQWATDTGFTNIVWTDNGPSGYTSPCGGAGPSLTPGTDHWVRLRSHTGAGWGPWSVAIKQTTLPAVAPGMAISSTVTGTAAKFILTPPGGVTGVTNYRLERRDSGTLANVVTYNSVAPSFTVAATLVPGKSYDWRASAFIGTYQSPFTSWVTLVQANPNTNPGSYWDGGTVDTAAADFAWSGTAENSTSTATGLHPTGWRTFLNADDTSGGTGAAFRATGGYQGAYAARYVFFTDATAAGFDPGGSNTALEMAEVDPLEEYFASIGAWPSRAQRLMARLDWYTAAGVFVSSSNGTASVVSEGGYTRLKVSGTAPGTAELATVRVVDVTGASWSTWKGGDWIQLDAMLISRGEDLDYFDGDTPNTSQYTYAWTGPANASLSTRTPGVSDTFDPLADPDCDPIPAAPRPSPVVDDCLEETTLWKRYLYTIPSSEVSEWQSTLVTMKLASGNEAQRQVRIRIYPNPFNYSQELVDFDNYCAEQIVSYLPPNTILTIDGELERVFAEVSDSGRILAADHLLYGTGGGPAVWPDLSCGITYLISVDVPPSATADLTAELTLTRRA